MGTRTGVNGFGSLTNLLTSRVKNAPTPEVGMGVTILGWTDRYPGTIVEVGPKGDLVVIQRDDARLISGSCATESQTYEYTRNENSAKTTYTLRKDGQWAERGLRQSESLRLVIGRREKYEDPSF